MITSQEQRMPRIGVLWRGDRRAESPRPAADRGLGPLFDAFAMLPVVIEPVPYGDDAAAEVREQLLGLDGVLVCVNPIQDGASRAVLDPLLREVSAAGVWVSAHPDVILQMGTKEVLYRTRALGWGTDTRRYRTAAQFAAEFPALLASGGPRVLKQNRGNDGQGVWKVEPAGKPDTVRVLEALRGSIPEELPLSQFIARCEAYFTDGGLIIDQPFQPRLPEGMIRCYMGVDKVVGFGHQLIKALIEPPPEGPDSPAAQPGPRIMYSPDAEPFQLLRAKVEEEWVPQMMQLLDIEAGLMPIIWDADFLYGPRTEAGGDSYVLCEINVSSVFAIPDQAPAAIARLALDRLRSHPSNRN